MKAKKVLLIISAVFLLAPGGVIAARDQHTASSQASVAEPISNPFTEALVRDLTASGFQVSQGVPKLYTFQDCIDHTYPSLKSCFLANPAAPYVMPVVKSWSDEYVDPAMVNAFVETEPGYSATYRLDPREAIVMFGKMPPPGRYMGLQTIEFSQPGTWKPKDYNSWANRPDLLFPIQYLFDTIPPNDPKSHRVITTSALGDLVNNVDMERQSGYPFGETRYFIITPSATTEAALRRSLQAEGVPDSHIFTQQIPREDDFGPIGPLGMGANAIDFLTMFRYAVPDDQYAAKKWRDDLPLSVLRVRAPDSLGPVQRYTSLTFEPRAANSEADLAGDLQNLLTAVCANVTSHSDLTSADCAQPPPDSSLMVEMVRDLGWVGPYCRSIDMNCNVDQQESALFFSSPRALDSGQVLAVVGTLATETGNATYVGLSANDASMMAGVTNVMDTDVTGPDGPIKGLKGSANSYGVENSGKFFVHFFTKDCAVLKDSVLIDNCSPTLEVQPAIGDPALQGKFIIALRDYIASETARGPDTTKLLTPRILTFRPQSAQADTKRP